MTNEERNISRKNRLLAIEYFKFNGEWFPHCVLHHINPTWQESDIERYIQWFPRDLQVLTISEHNSIHHKGANNPMYGRSGAKNPMFGKKHSEETKKKIGEKSKGRYPSQKTREKMSDARKGKHWYTNGEISILRMECPDGFRAGRIR